MTLSCLAFSRLDSITLDNEDITDIVRELRVGKAAADIAAVNEVRELVNSKLQQMSVEESIIMDGRDAGTNIIPNASLKYFLFASIEHRMKGWDKGQKSMNPELRELTRLDLIERDKRDLTRAVAPLVCPPDAYKVDMELLTNDEVIRLIVSDYSKLVSSNA